MDVEKIYDLFKYHSCLNNGICERNGNYVPIEDALKGDFETNRKFFSEGEELAGENEWIRIPPEY